MKKYKLTERLNTKDLYKLKAYLYDLSREYDMLDQESKTYVQKYLKNNNFFIQKINGKINELFWGVNHLICQIVNGNMPELKGNLLISLEKIKKKYKNDRSCEYRIESLIKQYGLDIKKEEV